MAKKLQLRRGTTTQHNSFTGAEGEVTVDTTKDSLVVHDGSTQGGHPIAKSSDIPNLNNYAALAGANFTGNILIDNAQELRLGEADGSGTNFTAFKAQAQSGDITLTLPAVAPTANQVLKADGSTPTTLTWASDVALTSIDEDNMASDSNTAVPTQQSVKAYVDTQVATKQAADADLTSLSNCQSGAAAALAALTSTEVEVLDGATLSTTELNYVDGVTSAIQTQLNAKGAGDAVLSGDQNWTGSQRGTISTATHSSGATYDFDMSAANNFKVTLSVTAELGFQNTSAGQSGTIEVVNGAFTPTWGSECHFVGGTVPSLTQSATSYLAYFAPSNSVVFVQTMLDVKQGGT
tara:strand:+ start:1046 stop:2095 length:1050 start_codon:yes stop_codon:yes gene_type:complete